MSTTHGATVAAATAATTRASSPMVVGTAAAAVVGVVLAALGTALLGDGDTSWHIATGELILREGLPTTDPFSFTRAGEPWIAKEWLSQLLLVAAWRGAGWGGVVVLAVVAVATAFGVLAHALARRLRVVPVVVVTAVAFVLAAPHVLARPHALAMPVAVLWTALLLRAVDDGPDAPPWLALPLVVLWANLHAGFTLGVALGVGVAVCAVVEARPDRRRRVASRWGGFVLASVVASLVTPYGGGPWLAAADVLRLGPALTIIGEWAPPDFSRPSAFEVILLAAVAAALLRPTRLSWPRVVLVLGLLHLALSATRNAELLGLLAPLVLAAPVAAQHASLRASDRAPAGRTVVTAGGLAIAALATVAVVTTAVRPVPPPVLSPSAATAALAAAGSQRVLHEYAWGGFLITEGVPTFVDGRTELFGGDLVARHDAALRVADVDLIDAVLAEWDIDATMLRPGTPAVDLLDRSSAWQRTHGDATAVVHVRTGPAPGLGALGGVVTE